MTVEVEKTDDEQPEIEEHEDAVEQEQQEEDPAAGLKTALAAERKARKTAERRARELETAQADANKEPAEQALDQARREAAAEATQKAHTRILRSEIRAAAKGRLADPSDAFAYLDLEEFEVNHDGEIDSDAIDGAINDLLTRKPYLAADTGEKFRGSADQGVRGKGAKPSQLSKDEMQKLGPAELLKAFNEGRLDTLVGRS